MENAFLLERLRGIQAALVAHHVGGAGMPAAASGSERETFLREFLQKLFPEGLRFGTGAVTDSSGARSGQLDIIIEYPILPSFPMPGGAERLYLAESVAAVLSVKSNLSAQWSEVEAEALKLAPLRRKWLGSTLTRGGTLVLQDLRESSIPFYAIGYTGYKTIEGLAKRLDDTDAAIRPIAALSIDSGTYVSATAKVSGEWGLYALAVTVATELRGLLGVSADAWAYAP